MQAVYCGFIVGKDVFSSVYCGVQAVYCGFIVGKDVFSSIYCVKRHISTENRGL